MHFIIDFARNNIEILGIIAGFLTTFGFAFQALKIFLNHNKKEATMGISIIMYVMFVMGIALWLIYGLAINQWVIVMWNGITFILACIVLFYTVRYNGPSWALSNK